MRYSIRGVWKLSGEVARMRLTAECEEHARRCADAVGVIAVEIEPEPLSSPEVGDAEGEREQALA